MNVKVHVDIKHGLVREYHKPGIKHDLGWSSVRTARRKQASETSHGKEYMTSYDDPGKE